MRCDQFNLTFAEEDKKYFFGIYETEPAKFQFKNGDVNLILEVVDHVKNKLADSGIEYFQVHRRRKVSFANSCQLSVGLFFARKERTVDITVAQSGIHSMNEQEMKDNLFTKKLLQPMLELASKELKLVRHINVDIVKIVVNNKKVRAEVLCVFCPDKEDHRIGIQCNSPPNSAVFYWNISNFKKHIDLHKKSGEEKIDVEDSIPLDDENTRLEDLQILASEALQAEEGIAANMKHRRGNKNNRSVKKKTSMKRKKSDVNKAIEVVSKKFDSGSISTSNVLNTVLKQMKDQNLQNIKNTLQNNEKPEQISFRLDSSNLTAKVVKVSANGTCFFGSIAHQFYGSKIDSDDHKQKTIELRVEAVTYLKDNFEKFKHDLQGRVYEHAKTKIDVNELDRECRVFLNACLPLPSCYAGYESVRAISELKKINIITITEQGDCFFAVDFNENFERIVFLCHRLGVSRSNNNLHNIHRNHYDSVSEIDNNVLCAIAEYLNGRQEMSNQLNNNEKKGNITID